MNDLHVRCPYDGRDYLSVLEIFYHDEEGEEAIHEPATDLCLGFVTCNDISEKFVVLKHPVEVNLRNAGIDFDSIEMEDELG